MPSVLVVWFYMYVDGVVTAGNKLGMIMLICAFYHRPVVIGAECEMKSAESLRVAAMQHSYLNCACKNSVCLCDVSTLPGKPGSATHNIIAASTQASTLQPACVPAASSLPTSSGVKTDSQRTDTQNKCRDSRRC